MVLKIGIIDGENTSQYTGSFSGSFTGSLSDSGLDLQEITDEGNITTNMVRASGLQSLEKAAVSISASAGWYRVLKFNSNNNRGGGVIKISTTGGSFQPATWVINYYKTWESTQPAIRHSLKLEQYANTDYITKARIVHDSEEDDPPSSASYVEIYKNATSGGSSNGDLTSVRIYHDELLGFSGNALSTIPTENGYLLATDPDSENITSSIEMDFIIDGTSMEYLYVTESAGIGVSTPTTALQVNGTTSSSKFVAFGGAGGGYYLDTTASLIKKDTTLNLGPSERWDSIKIGNDYSQDPNQQVIVGPNFFLPGIQSVNTGTSVLTVDSSGKVYKTGSYNSGGNTNTPNLQDVTDEGNETSLAITASSIRTSVISSGADISIDADGADIILSDGGVEFGTFKRASSDFVIKSEGAGNEMIFKTKNASNTVVENLTLNSSGNASFAKNVLIPTLGSSPSTAKGSNVLTIDSSGTIQKTGSFPDLNKFSDLKLEASTAQGQLSAANLNLLCTTAKQNPLTQTVKFTAGPGITINKESSQVIAITSSAGNGFNEIIDTNNSTATETTPFNQLKIGNCLQVLTTGPSTTADVTINFNGYQGSTNHGIMTYVPAAGTVGGASEKSKSNANFTFDGTTAYINAALGVGTNTPTVTGLIRATSDVVAFYSSDKRLKENITPITNALDKLDKINGIEFDWVPKEGIHENEGHDIGVIAQEVEKVIPEIVQTRDNGYKAVKYEKIVPLLIESIKELKAEIEKLKKSK